MGPAMEERNVATRAMKVRLRIRMNGGKGDNGRKAVVAEVGVSRPAALRLVVCSEATGGWDRNYIRRSDQFAEIDGVASSTACWKK
jgi:hypothetical protein